MFILIVYPGKVQLAHIVREKEVSFVCRARSFEDTHVHVSELGRFEIIKSNTSKMIAHFPVNLTAVIYGDD